MAINTGPDVNTYQIPEVELGDTFNTWRDITNLAVYKLNKLKAYEGVSGDEVTVLNSPSGTFAFRLADTIQYGHTFQGAIRFTNGVTFDGDVTFNASTFTVNANTVTIDDYSIVLGASATSSDGAISTAGGGGVLLYRGTVGGTAEWLWLTNQIHGFTGIWRANAHIGFSGATHGIVPSGNGILPVHGSGIRIDGGATTEHGLQISLLNDHGATDANRTIEFSRYTLAGSTAFIEVLNGTTYGQRPFVKIDNGVNRKTVKTAGAHGLLFGMPVKYDAGNPNKYVAAEADSSTNAEVIGVVSEVISAIEFELTFVGEIFGDFGSVLDDSAGQLTEGAVYYLSPYNPGKITSVQPLAGGQVQKAVLIATGTKSAVVLPFTGGELATPVQITNASSLTTRINQFNRFRLGDFVRFNPYPSGVTLRYFTNAAGNGNTADQYHPTGIYVKAQANTAPEAEVAGMVVAVGGATGNNINNLVYQNFDILVDGFFDGITYTYGTALTPGNVYWLAVGCAAAPPALSLSYPDKHTTALENNTPSFQPSAPTVSQQVSKAVFLATGARAGYLYADRGVLGGVVTVQGASVDVGRILITDLRDGVSGDLVVSHYSGAIQGREVMRIAAGTSNFANSKGITGYVGMGSNVASGSPWSNWGSGAAGNRIIAPLDLIGHARIGDVLTSTPQGRPLIVSRYQATDTVSGTSAPAYNVIGTEYGTGNLQIGYGVQGATTSALFTSTLPFATAKSSLIVGACAGQNEGVLSFLTQSSATTPVNGISTLTEHFRMSGPTAYFSGSVGFGVAAPILITGYGRSITATSNTGAALVLTDSDASSGSRVGFLSQKDGVLRLGKAGDAGASPTAHVTILLADGKVGIGTEAPTQALHVIGQILASQDITALSDRRLKTNISAISDALDKVLKLNGVLYTNTEGSRRTGLIAQDVLSVLPEAVHTAPDAEGYHSLAYGNLVGLLVEAIKELNRKIDALGVKPCSGGVDETPPQVN